MKYRDKIAPYWDDLGKQLLQDEYVHQLSIIQTNYPTNAQKCCDEMFQYWLAVDVKANWNKLINALEVIQQNVLAAKIRQDISTGEFY